MALSIATRKRMIELWFGAAVLAAAPGTIYLTGSKVSEVRPAAIFRPRLPSALKG